MPTSNDRLDEVERLSMEVLVACDRDGNDALGMVFAMMTVIAVAGCDGNALRAAELMDEVCRLWTADMRARNAF